MSNWYRSEIWLLFWKIPAQYFDQRIEASKPSDIDDAQILKAVKSIWRPFCRIKWVKV